MLLCKGEAITSDAATNKRYIRKTELIISLDVRMDGRSAQSFSKELMVSTCRNEMAKTQQRFRIPDSHTHILTPILNDV